MLSASCDYCSSTKAEHELSATVSPLTLSRVTLRVRLLYESFLCHSNFLLMCSRRCKNWKRTLRDTLPRTKPCRLQYLRNKDYQPPEADLLTNPPCSKQYIVFKHLDVHKAAGWGEGRWLKGGGAYILSCPIFLLPVTFSLRCRNNKGYLQVMRHKGGMVKLFSANGCQLTTD